MSDPLCNPERKDDGRGGSMAGAFLIVGVLLMLFAASVQSWGPFIVGAVLFVPALVGFLLEDRPPPADPRRPWEGR